MTDCARKSNIGDPFAANMTGSGNVVLTKAELAKISGGLMDGGGVPHLN
jgi:bacteriocin-like protein